MIVREPGSLKEAIRRDGRRDASAVPKAVFMVEPVSFRVELESAVDNRYLQTDAKADPRRAAAQSAELGRAIAGCGVPVVRFPGEPGTPDAVFPNNVFATVPGRLVVGSMRHELRRREAERTDIRRFFSDVLGYEVVDLSQERCVAELTGPMVIDRARGIGFCGMTDRVDDAGAVRMHRAFDLALTFCFDLRPGEYHTNVVMSVLAGRALVIHPDSIVDRRSAAAVMDAFDAVLELDDDECENFAGNCIAVSDRDLFFSERAADSLRPGSLARLESWGFEIHAVAVDELEKAGGSVRCMIGEVF